MKYVGPAREEYSLYLEAVLSSFIPVSELHVSLRKLVELVLTNVKLKVYLTLDSPFSFNVTS